MAAATATHTGYELGPWVLVALEPHLMRRTRRRAYWCVRPEGWYLKTILDEFDGTPAATVVGPLGQGADVYVRARDWCLAPLA